MTRTCPSDNIPVLTIEQWLLRHCEDGDHLLVKREHRPYNSLTNLRTGKKFLFTTHSNREHHPEEHPGNGVHRP